MLRTHKCGELILKDDMETVTLTGWVDRCRDHGGVAFMGLRDASGIVRLVVNEAVIREVYNEYVLKVTGRVRRRPDGNDNPEISTGEIEVVAEDVEVLNPCAPLPFQVSEHAEEAGKVGGDVRLCYRFVDLRRCQLHNNLVLRAKISSVARRVMEKHEFLEIETPTLTRSTPEGACDFVIPARIKSDFWYALPQSSQLFKQLLMVGGMEHYYQLARCYRDEDSRADRQPGSTQLNLEMSFVDQDDVMAVTEDLLKEARAVTGYDLKTPIPRVPLKEAMDKYGSDKPDLRFDYELAEPTEYSSDTPFKISQAPYVDAAVMPGSTTQPRRTFDKWQEWAKVRGTKGSAYATIAEDGITAGPVAKNTSDTEHEGLAEVTGTKSGDCIFFVAGKRTASQELLGVVRPEVGKRCGLINPRAWVFTWVVDAPLFKPSGQAEAEGDVALGHSAWTAVHHALTSPKPECMDTFGTNPDSALAYAHDVACNRVELGGGSICVHRRGVQERIFKVMGFSPEEAQARFGLLLDAFKCGAPSHGGLALGQDRIVGMLIALPSTRGVIAFPRAGDGFDPLTGAPVPTTDEQRKETGVDWKPNSEDSEEEQH